MENLEYNFYLSQKNYLQYNNIHEGVVESYGVALYRSHM